MPSYKGSILGPYYTLSAQQANIEFDSLPQKWTADSYMSIQYSRWGNTGRQRLSKMDDKKVPKGNIYLRWEISNKSKKN